MTRPSLESSTSSCTASSSLSGASLISRFEQILVRSHSAFMQDDRTPRKQNKAEKLYRFLTRSRSRSRHTDDEQENHNTTPASKPTRISHSRPLSSTTATTNATVTPYNNATPKASLHRPHSGTRKKLHNLFRKSASNSRPTSPEPELELPKPSPPRPYRERDETLWTTRIPSRPSSPSPRRLHDSTSNTSLSQNVDLLKRSQLANGMRVSHPRPKTNLSRSASDCTAPEHQSKQTSNRRDQTASSSSRPRSSSLSKEPSTSSNNTTLLPQRTRHRKDSIDSAYRYRPMAVVDEERSTPDATKSNGHPAKVKARALRGTKHGSFDFERPGWAGSVVRSPSGESGSTGLSNSVGPSQSKESLSNGRINSLQKKPNIDRTPPNSEPGHSSKSLHTHLRSDSAGEPTEPASLGRKTGKRILGSGIARLVGFSHGPFPFEPPVPPSPTISNASTRESVKERRERDKSRSRERDERQREKERKRAARRIAVAPEPPPPPPHESNAGFRSGTKGRSLDLGLGLSWAPTRMREDALLPSSVVFGKNVSASSRNGLLRKIDIELDRSKVGKEVAEAFRNALDEEGYIAFKKYVHRFDAHDIPFDGPTGILTRAEKLLDRSSNLTDEGKRRLLDRLVRIILQNT